MSKLTRKNAKEVLAQRDPSDLSDLDEPLYEEQKPPQPAAVLPRPVGRKPLHQQLKEKPMSLSKYSEFLLANAIAKFCDQTLNPNGNYENRNINRDTFVVSALQSNDYNIKTAAAVIQATMQGAKVPAATIASTIDSLCFNVLKQAMFSVWLDYNRALRVQEGLMPDSFFDKLMTRRPAPENAEDSIDDVKLAPVDRREELLTAPAGLDTDYVDINGFEWQINDDIAHQVAEGLEDLRVYLENIRLAFGVKADERLPFFIEQVNGAWVRHSGSVYSALLAYEQKMGERNKQRAVEEALFFRSAQERLTKAV